MIIGYAFEPADYELLQQIARRLHGDGTVLTSDARRDLANLMSLVVPRAVALTEADLPASVGLPEDRS